MTGKPDMFKKAKAMEFPREVVAGHNVIEDVGGMAKRFGLGKMAMIISGKYTVKLAGERVAQVLEDSGFDVVIVETGEATKENLNQLIEDGREVSPSFVLGVGGGSKIDLSKMVSLDLDVPFISIPTSAAHDGIASPRASIKNANGSVSMEARVPFAVVADTGIIVKAPHRFLASGCADVISNQTALLDWELAHRLRNEEISTSSYTLAKYSSDFIIEHATEIKPNLEESVWRVIKPIIISGIAMGVAGSTRPASGSEHMFSHALDIIAPGRALHGEQCGIGTIMMMYLHGGDWKAIKQALKTIGAPTTASELGVSREQVIEALTMAHTIRPERYTILGDSGITEDAAENLAETTGVI